MANMIHKNRRSRAQIGSSLVGMIAAFLLLLGGVPAAQAENSVVTIETSAVASVAESGSRISFRVNYSCSTLFDVCRAPVVYAAAPIGTAPGGASIAVTAGSGQVVRSAHVQSVSGTDPLEIQFQDLPGGTTGQVTVSWLVPNFETPPGTTFQQRVSLSPSGGSPAESQPVSITAVSEFRANLLMQSPSTAGQVVTGMDVTYLVYDCNPGFTALNGLGYNDLVLELSLPAGVVITQASGGTVTEGSGSTPTTLRWEVAEPSLNDCEVPSRTYPVTVQYPTSFNPPTPPSGQNPTNRTVTVALEGSATGLDGVPLSSVADPISHVFAGRAADLAGTDYISFQSGSFGMYPQTQGITSANGVTPYGFISSQWWWSTVPGEVRVPDVYQLNSVLARVPCIVGDQVQDRIPGDYDQIQNGGIGPFTQQDNPCASPAYSPTRLEFRDIVAPWVWAVQVQTTDGTTSQVREWVIPERPTRAFYLDMYADAGDSAPLAVAGSFAGDPAQNVQFDEPEALPEDEGNTLPPVTPRDAAEPQPQFLNSPFTDMTITNPETLSMNIPDTEVVTDIRVVYRDVPYYTRAFVGIWGVSTPAFIDLADGQAASMNIKVRNYTNGNQYTQQGSPNWGWLYAGNILNLPMQFQQAVSDPQISGEGIFALTGTNALGPGDSVTWQFGITNGPNGVSGGCEQGVPNSCNGLQPEAIVVLPPGLDYEPGSATWSNLEVMGGVEPELVIGTVSDGYPEERVTLAWSWPGGQRIPNPIDDAGIAQGVVPTVNFDTRVNLYAHEGHNDGVNAIEVTLFDVSGVFEAEPGSAAELIDVNDLNRNGNARERVAFASADWTVASSSGIQIRALSQGDIDSEWTDRGRVGLTWDPAGGSGAFRFEARNVNTSAVRDLVMYSTLPRPGDTAMGEALGDEARGSSWTPVFAGLDERSPLRSGAQVFYSTSDNSCRPELFPSGQGVCDDDWSAALPAELSSVRALKVVESEDYAPTTELNPPLVFGYRVTAPPVTSQAELEAASATAANTNVAWRGARVTGPAPTDIVMLEPAEAPIAALTYTAGEISGRIWDDANGDGLQTSGELGVADVRAALLDEDGNEVTDPHGTVATAKTSGAGEYVLRAPIDSYRVGFSNIPDGAAWTAQVPDDGTMLASDVNPSTGQTAAIQLSDSEPFRQHVDGGLIGIDAAIPPGSGGQLLPGTGAQPTNIALYAVLAVLAGGVLVQLVRRQQVRAGRPRRSMQ